MAAHPFRFAVLLVAASLLLWAAASPGSAVALAGPPIPTHLSQRDGYGALPVGEMTGSPRLEFRFRLEASAGLRLTPELEVRSVATPFSGPNFSGDAFVTSGSPQTAAVWTMEPLAPAGYHWRLRLRLGAKAGPWVAFGSNGDEVGGAEALAAADFYALHEPLLPDARPLVGFESLTRLAALPLLAPGVETRQVSSFDRAEGNTDGGSDAPGLESRFYQEDGAEVVLEVDGPGQINRIWFAEANDPAFANTRLQFFFDHAAAPSYEITIVDMTSGQTPPFVRPLVLGPDLSSGGWISYVPIPFRQGVEVRLLGPHVHYQITYQVFSSPAGVTTFRGNEDYSLAQHLWQRSGQDPKPTRGNRHLTGSGSLAPGATTTLFELEGGGVLQSLRLWIPQLESSILGAPPQTDTVRGHQNGASSFRLTPARPAIATRLRLRRFCRFAPQAAQVTVNGVELGRWERQLSEDRYRWCDDSFDLPPQLVGKEPLSLRIASADSPAAWYEAFYWLEQAQGLDWVVVDALDVGDPADEQRHDYTISGQAAAGSYTATYRPLLTPQPASESLLAGLRLRISVDHQPQPLVDAPVGAFFGSARGQANITSLMAGMRPEDDSFYSFWPMPFGSRLRVELVNASPNYLADFRFQAAHSPRRYPLPGRVSGYFRVFESLSRPTTPGRDHPLVTATSAGKLVGLHLLVHSGGEGFIEGDERFHTDGARTPTVRGTGTEDIFNSAWYYNRGRVITAVHGANSTRSEGWVDQYRWYLSDAIPFAAGLQGGIEHGGGNDIDADYSSWVFLYQTPAPALLRADVVELGLAADREAHDVILSGPAMSGPATVYTLTAMFEGDDDTAFRAAGYRLPLGSAITLSLSLDPNAAQITLRRRYDQGVGIERLLVHIDGQPAPDWLDGGRNRARRWRESTYLVPPELTFSKRQITVRLEAAPWAGSDSANLSALAAFSQHRAWLSPAGRQGP